MARCHACQSGPRPAAGSRLDRSHFRFPICSAISSGRDSIDLISRLDRSHFATRRAATGRASQIDLRNLNRTTGPGSSTLRYVNFGGPPGRDTDAPPRSTLRWPIGGLAARRGALHGVNTLSRQLRRTCGKHQLWTPGARSTGSLLEAPVSPVWPSLAAELPWASRFPACPVCGWLALALRMSGTTLLKL